MSTLDVEGVDLAELARVATSRALGLLEGAVTGRSLLRDVVVEHLECSMLEAETLVDTLIARGYFTLTRDDEGREIWVPANGT
jgi:hypothetical protein